MRAATLRLKSPFTVAARTTRNMATASSSSASAEGPGSGSRSGNKLVFAPSGSHHPHRADQYTANPPLLLSTLSPDPFTQFHSWFASARAHPVPLAESVCLSTASLPSGRVSSRFVYLKELDSRGFVIYSNWGTSRKARDVATNGFAGLAFWWREVERQVRVEGKVERLTREESQRYFDLRARGSKIGAWASRQSEVLPEKGDAGEEAAAAVVEGKEDGDGGTEAGQQGSSSTSEGGRRTLDHWVHEVEARFANTPDEEIPCPDFWGGIRIVPELIEFWQGRDSRLHDRFQYTRIGGGGGEEREWRIDRLSP